MRPETIDFDRLLTRARQLTDPAARLAAQLRGLLGPDIHTFTPTENRAGAYACVDGAVASEQTDAVTWTTCVGVRQSPGLDDVVVPCATVTPVGAETDRVRGALMASAEVAAALSTPPERQVFMDGGIATPLVSIAQGLAVTAPAAMDAIHEHYTHIDMPGLVADYVEAVLAGQIAALPKQDTSSAYSAAWAREHAHTVDAEVAQTLAGLRDRPTLTAVLRPGEWFTPRLADEMRHVEAKMMTRDGLRPARVDAHYARLREHDALHVLYFKPSLLPERVIKVEYRETDPGTWADARRLIALLDSQTLGPRIREPIMQHEADAAAKQHVTLAMGEVMATATAALGFDAVAAYRTTR